VVGVEPQQVIIGIVVAKKNSVKHV
jgi:hypothetical protein